MPFVHLFGINASMDPRIVAENTIMTLLGPVTGDPKVLNDAVSLATILVAADGGANVAVDANLKLDAVIGDMDSITAETRAALAESAVIHVHEQETTDFEKCLQRVSADVILAVGFLGGRIDHSLSTFNVLSRFPEQPVILVGDEDIVFLAPPRIELALPVGTRISLFPFAPLKGHSVGLNWPIDGIAFRPDTKIGVSNSTNKANVSLSFDTQKMFVILPTEFLNNVIAALRT